MDTDFKCLVIMLRALKCLGLCPLDQQNPTKVQTARYGFVWNSKGTVLSLIVASFMAFVHFVSLTHGVFRQYFIFGPSIRHAANEMEAKIGNSSHSTQTQIGAHLGVFTAIRLMAVVQYFSLLWASWRNRHILPQFLNDAISLGEMQGPDVQAKSNHRVVSFATLVYGFTTALIPGYFSSLSITAHEDAFIEFLFSGFIFVYMLLMEFGHDTAVVFALRHLRHNFNQMRRRTRVCQAPHCTTIDNWENTVYSIRQQGCLLSTYLAPSQLMSLAQTIVMTTIGTFSALMVARANDSESLGLPNPIIQYIVGNMTFAVYMMGRLYFKVSLAQQVTNEENQLALELGRLAIKEHEPAVKVKRLVDMMNCKPCEINLSDLVIMRKRLFLGVASQISTYLIVIMQFYQS